MNKPAISVIIPVFNREKLVLDTLESLKLQSFDNWECILVDDYSTDNTIQEIERFIANDTRFKLIQKKTEPKGAPSSRNIGWRKATAEYIVFLDSDDLLAPWALETRIRHFQFNPGLDFNLSCNVEFKKDIPHKMSRALYNTENPLKSFLSFRAVWQTSSPTWKKEFLLKLNGWDEDAISWQDGEIHIRALLQNPKYKWISEKPDVFLRTTRAESITFQTSVHKYENNIKIFSKIFHLLNVEFKIVFKKNISIWVFNLIEKLSYSEAKLFIEITNFGDFFASKSILKFYAGVFHYTKNIIILRHIVFLLREYSNLLTKRKRYFVKTEISKNIVEQLKSELSKKELFTKNISWLN